MGEGEVEGARLFATVGEGMLGCNGHAMALVKTRVSDIHTHARTHARTRARARTHTHARMHARTHARTHTIRRQSQATARGSSSSHRSICASYRGHRRAYVRSACLRANSVHANGDLATRGRWSSFPRHSRNAASSA